LTIGPRVWKTGLAALIALIICQQLNLPSAYLAVIAAIVSMRSSVSQSLAHAGHRTAATVIGGTVGLVLMLAWESNPITVGVAIIISILICIKLNLQEAINLTGITVAVVMVGVEGDPAIYVGERLLVTVIGLCVGTTVNLIFYPPQREKLLREEIDQLNQMLKLFYIYITRRFFDSTDFYESEVEEKTEEIRLQFENVRRIFFEFKEEIGYLSSLEKIKNYEKIISTLYLLFERIQGVYQTADNRNKRILKQRGSRVASQLYQEIISISRQLVNVTVGMQGSLSCAGSQNQELYQFTSSYAEQGEEILKELRHKISQWHLEEDNRNKSATLVEISTIYYEMERIFKYTTQLQDLLCSLYQMEEQKADTGKTGMLQKVKSYFVKR